MNVGCYTRVINIAGLLVFYIFFSNGLRYIALRAQNVVLIIDKTQIHRFPFVLFKIV